jgi:type IV pilus assembly protein PilC
MTMYRYRALDPDGKPVEDSMEAPSAHAVTRKLQERGLTVNAVEEAFPDRRLLRVSGKLSWDDLQLLSEQLASIVRGGLPLAASLKALSTELHNPRLQPVLQRLHQDLEHGVALDDAIDRQHAQFPRIYPALIRAGEATGNLPGVLGLISQHAARMLDLRQRLQIAMIYPVILTVVSFFIIGFIVLKVVPVFNEIFADFGGQLPAPTRLLLAVSELLQHSWTDLLTVLFLLIALVVAAITWSRRSVEGRCRLDLVKLYFPWVGPAYYLHVQARFCRVMSLLLASRVPVLDALELAGAASGSPVLERALEDAVLSVASGERLVDALERTRFFGHDTCWLLSTSEDRGATEEAFEHLAERFEHQALAHDKFFGALAAPVFAVVMGGIIGFVVICLYLPIFTLGDQIRM